MRLRQRPAQGIGRRRHEHQVDMVRHQAPRPDGDAGAARVLAQQCEIGAIVVVAEEDGLPPISPLGHMMGHGGNDDAGQARHEATVAVDDETVKLVLCPQIFQSFRRKKTND